jgi:micrococcal nuclease
MDFSKSNKVSLLTAIALIFLSISNFLLLSNKENLSERYGNQVINVIDGDTIVINKGVLVRLHGIDAPDIENCGGQKAKQKLEELVMNKNVSIESISRIYQNRILSLVYINDTLVNEILLKQGHAELTGSTISEIEKLKKANQHARKKKIGIYRECISTQPPNKECNIKGNIDARDKTQIYHLPGCYSYNTTIVETFRGEKWFCSEKEAQKEGFKKAKNCP